MRRLVLLAALAFAVTPVRAQPPASTLPTVETYTAGLVRDDGLFPLYTDTRRGLAYLEVPRTGEDVLYQVSLAAGLGSNDVGLDRGQLGPSYVVRFERAGGRLLLVAPNVDYRSSSANAAERLAVREAFAEGVLFSFPIVAESPSGALLVDAAPFAVRDAHGVAQTLARTGQGSFSLDPMRSSMWFDATKAFPRNTELEARLTFASPAPGAYVRSVAAEPSSVTLRVRHSLVALPDAGYVPQAFDPRSGYFAVEWRDYSVPLGEPLRQQRTVRHRLVKRDPSAAVSDVVEPIVYYLDPGTPEPVRSALLDGARWWTEAFEAAGFRNAFRVEVAPDTLDPLDVRYNVIQWVHRSTRGWSYGAAVVDPRTGEILKGHVSLGSLRVRQDYLIAEGLLAPYPDGAATDGSPADGVDGRMAALALARLRQLSAHEVGHTLGLAHNFAASTNGRASVMDYPAPRVTVRRDAFSTDSAYAVGVGAWDVAAIRMGYGTPRPGQSERARFEAALADARRQGLVYLSDRDHAGGLDPRTVQWDNYGDVRTGFRQAMELRRVALGRFSEAVIRPGRPVAEIEAAFVPLYLGHRYAVAGVARLLGGQRYDIALRGDGTDARTRPVPVAEQREALRLLLSALAPEALRLPDAVRRLAPLPPGTGPTRESLPGRTGIAFDVFAPAEVAAALVVDELVRPDRAARLALQRAAFPEVPGLPTYGDVLADVTEAVWKAPMPAGATDAQTRRTVQTVWTDALAALASDPAAPAVVRAEATYAAEQLALWLDANAGAGERAHRRYAARVLRRALDRPAPPLPAATVPALVPPPGAPIGTLDGAAPDRASADDTPGARHRARLAGVPADGGHE